MITLWLTYTQVRNMKRRFNVKKPREILITASGDMHDALELGGQVGKDRYWKVVDTALAQLEEYYKPTFEYCGNCKKMKKCSDPYIRHCSGWEIANSLELTNRPSVVFKKVNGRYEECFIDNEDVFKGWIKVATPLEPIDERRIEEVLSKIETPIEESLLEFVQTKNKAIVRLKPKWTTLIAHSIASHFGISKKLEGLDALSIEKAILDYQEAGHLLGATKPLSEYLSSKFSSTPINLELLEACKALENALTNLSYMFDFPNRFKESFNAIMLKSKQAISNAEKTEKI